MRILMLGNSLTAANHMPDMLAKLLDADVRVHARGGARLSEQLNPNTKMGARTRRVLQEKSFDFVILQEMSNGPATSPERYLDSVRRLTDLIRKSGAEPVIYATWAFRPDAERLATIEMDTLTLHKRMQETFQRAEAEHGMPIANVGQEFYNRGFAEELYAPDGLHPSEEGSRIAAEILARTCRAAVGYRSEINVMEVNDL